MVQDAYPSDPRVREPEKTGSGMDQSFYGPGPSFPWQEDVFGSTAFYMNCGEFLD